MVRDWHVRLAITIFVIAAMAVCPDDDIFTVLRVILTVMLVVFWADYFDDNNNRGPMIYV